MQIITIKLASGSLPVLYSSQFKFIKKTETDVHKFDNNFMTSDKNICIFNYEMHLLMANNYSSLELMVEGGSPTSYMRKYLKICIDPDT